MKRWRLSCAGNKSIIQSHGNANLFRILEAVVSLMSVFPNFKVTEESLINCERSNSRQFRIEIKVKGFTFPGKSMEIFMAQKKFSSILDHSTSYKAVVIKLLCFCLSQGPCSL